MMFNKYLILFLLLFIGAELKAQQSHATLDWAPHKIENGLTPFLADTISPVVHDDQTVTFTIAAPDAEEILLSWSILTGLGSDRPVPFIKGEDGVWTLTVGPLAPNIYKYKLVIDGVSHVDPSNTFGGFENQPGYSYVVVHGDGPAWYDAKNVPHGTVARHIYHSDVLDGEREIYVYTPPGYDSSEEYPVLYLLGGSGELASTWSRIGRVNFIMDNLIAEEKYSVKTSKHDRAIAGLSMGGRQAQVIGMNNLDLFGSIGILSGAESLDLTPGVFDDPDLNDKIDYLFIGAGTNETSPDSRHVRLHEQFEERNVDHVYYIGSKGAHDFVTWRHLLYYEFLPNLWRDH